MLLYQRYFLNILIYSLLFGWEKEALRGQINFTSFFISSAGMPFWIGLKTNISTQFNIQNYMQLQKRKKTAIVDLCFLQETVNP
jgi:hypothetical protein